MQIIDIYLRCKVMMSELQQQQQHWGLGGKHLKTFFQLKSNAKEHLLSCASITWYGDMYQVIYSVSVCACYILLYDEWVSALTWMFLSFYTTKPILNSSNNQPLIDSFIHCWITADFHLSHIDHSKFIKIVSRC